MLDCVLSAYFVLARLAASRNNFSYAYALLEQAENLGLSRQWGRLVAAAVLERVRLSCLEGRISESVAHLDRLDRIAKEYPVSKPCAWSDIHHYGALARARVALLQDDSRTAISILKNLQREVENAHSYYFGLRVDTDLATAHFRTGDLADALATLRKVLDKGLRGGVYETILDQGPEIGPLLVSVRENAARTRDPADFVSYVDRLIEGHGARYKSQGNEGTTSAVEEPLSAREGNVLNLIAEGRSNKEIARILAIAPETVKSHVKHIFIKLNVERRAQAVSRAQSLGLVGTL
jgi:ATP/maltotriose-dependent transcriptional regulator MalT